MPRGSPGATSCHSGWMRSALRSWHPARFSSHVVAVEAGAVLPDLRDPLPDAGCRASMVTARVLVESGERPGRVVPGVGGGTLLASSTPSCAATAAARGRRRPGTPGLPPCGPGGAAREHWLDPCRPPARRRHRGQGAGDSQQEGATRRDGHGAWRASALCRPARARAQAGRARGPGAWQPPWRCHHPVLPRGPGSRAEGSTAVGQRSPGAPCTRRRAGGLSGRRRHRGR